MSQPHEPGDSASPEQQSADPAQGSPATPQWPSTSGGDVGGQVPPPPAPPAAPAYGPMPQTSNSAIISLVLAIVSWVVCPIIPAIIALVFASKADKEIAVSNGWVTGGGLVTAAKIVSWINIGLYAAIIALGLLFVVIAAVGGAFA